ncbi:MAG: hypothetical protein HRU28_08730 [Rhizobiales bacterium]|nr:hypothetical protein [Hyphomicrobiales bacterium]
MNILPNAFGPADLGITGALMEAQNHNLSIASTSDLALTALVEANASYSPYTNDFSGVALLLANGTTYGGRYAENAAYNPSKSLMEMALSNMNMGEAEQSSYRIIEALLVEPSTAAISQREACENLLSAVSPLIILQYIVADSQ